MWAAAWTTVVGFVLLCILVYFISRRHYPIPFEWGRLVRLAAATGVTLAAGYGRRLAHGRRASPCPSASSWSASSSRRPVLLLFPLVLLATGFFTGGEKAAAAGRMAAPSRPGRRRGPMLGEASPEHPADHLSADDVAAEEEAARDRGGRKARTERWRPGRGMSVPMKLLVVANPYPPMASAGTNRVVRFLRHLPDHGWEPTVLTARAAGPAAEPPGVRVVRAPVPWPRAASRRGAAQHAREQLGQRARPVRELGRAGGLEGPRRCCAASASTPSSRARRGPAFTSWRPSWRGSRGLPVAGRLPRPVVHLPVPHVPDRGARAAQRPP